MPVFYLAWTAEGEPFSAGTHATAATKVWDGAEGDEQVFSLEIDHSEGEFPSLVCELKNPRVGLLSAGRNQWIWLSADEGAGPQPLFNGRIIGVPKNLAGEVVEVQFVARPPDYIAQREALAASLRVLPWFDRVWLNEAVDEPDTVLETYAARWHIDRVLLAVSTSDITAGEDGVIVVDESQHFYDGIEVTYGDPPLHKVEISLTVTWHQTGSGDIDLTRQLVAAFNAAGSLYPEPLIASFTGQGLFDDWPAPGDSIGSSGWSIASNSTIEPATWMQPYAKVVHYGDRSEVMEFPWADPLHQTPSTMTFGQPVNVSPQSITAFGSPAIGVAQHDATEDAFGNWEAAYSLGIYKVHLVVHWEADRSRAEIVTTSVEADVQPLLTDPGSDATDRIELSSDLVGELIDPDVGSPGAFDRPIGDLRRNSYFKTDRGAQSLEYALLLARAKLLSRARAVQITFHTPWEVMSSASCRHSVQLFDYRLPGGSGTGKIINYRLSANGDDGEIGAEVTIGCSIGYGVPLGAVPIGEPLYVEDGYVDDPYQQRSGAYTEILVGELQYESFDEFEVTDDDGVDLFNLTATTAVNSLTVTGGINEQTAAIDAEVAKNPIEAPSPDDVLEATPTVVTLDMVPVEGGDFSVSYEPTVSPLVVPMTIDLEAA